MAEDNVFPQAGDQDFAENFASWLGRGNISSYVETGLTFTPDYANNNLDISTGKSYIIIDSETISANNETRLVLDYAVTTDSVVDLSITASDTTYIYLNPRLSNNDGPVFETETDKGNAQTNWLLIGSVDTANNTYEEINREPSADFDTLTARNTLSVPTYSELSNASSSQSSVIYIDGNGTTESGLYVHDGTQYGSAGLDGDEYVLKSGDTMTGALNVGTNSINGTNSTQLNFTSAGLDLHTDGSGSGDITIKDSLNSNDIAIFNEGSNVEIPNDGLTVSGSSTFQSSLSLANNTGITIASGETVTYGRDHGTSVGESVAIGVGARALSDSSGTLNDNDPKTTAIGHEAARNSDQFAVTASGYNAARDNTGGRVTASGFKSGLVNTGDKVTASGYQAALDNSGNNVTGFGYRAADSNLGEKVTATGSRAAQVNGGNRVTALGSFAARGDGLDDPTTMGDDNIGIGNNAIRFNQASGLIAIGQDAGIDAQTDDQFIVTDRNGTRRFEMDLTNGDISAKGNVGIPNGDLEVGNTSGGDVRIAGELTENASL